MDGAGVTVMVLVELTTGHGPDPSGSSEVKVRMTVPKKLASGVKVIDSGEDV
jgi:hypothetical protein